jgi:hypothetical protein
MTVDLFAICYHSIYLVSESHVLSFLGYQVVLSIFDDSYIFYSNILTSIINFVFDYSVECLPSFSAPWKSDVRFFRDESSSVSWEFNFLVRDCMFANVLILFRVIRRKCYLFRGPGSF